MCETAHRPQRCPSQLRTRQKHEHKVIVAFQYTARQHSAIRTEWYERRYDHVLGNAERRDASQRADPHGE